LGFAPVLGVSKWLFFGHILEFFALAGSANAGEM